MKGRAFVSKGETNPCKENLLARPTPRSRHFVSWHGTSVKKTRNVEKRLVACYGHRSNLRGITSFLAKLSRGSGGQGRFDDE